MRTIIILCLITALLPGCKRIEEDNPEDQSLYGDQATCIELSKTLKSDELLPICLKEISDGNRGAEVILGEAFARESQWDQAIEWLKTSAMHGDSYGQYLLGKAYFEGTGMRRDPRMAVTWFLESAKAGYSPAQLMVAKIYHKGDCIEPNEYVAFQWYASCAQKEPEAAFEMGLAYLLGQLGQAKNISLGLHYVDHAAKNDYAPAKALLRKIEEKNKNKELPEQKRRLKKMGEAALKGSVQAQFDLAKNLIQYSIPQYDKAALYWMNMAASQGDEEAKYWLGEFYYKGIGTEVDYYKAFTIFVELALKGHPLSQYRLGKMYYEGQGTEQDNMMGKKWITDAAEQGVEEALAMISNWPDELNREIVVENEYEDDLENN